MQARIQPYFHDDTNTWTYLVSCPTNARAVIIDPVLDYDAPSGRIATHAADALIAVVREQGMTLDWILETHAHADHLSAAKYLQAELGGEIGIGRGITEVQATFKTVFDLEPGFATDGSQFDRLIDEGDELAFGECRLRAMATPGHTSDSMTYLVDDAAFIGDTLFMPDGGTARCDFPGGDAGLLYDSIQKLFALPPETRIFVNHDYGPDGRAFQNQTTVAEEREDNIMIGGGISREDFIDKRRARDAGLSAPKLLYPAVQINIRAGARPPKASNGSSYLKIPLRYPGWDGG